MTPAPTSLRPALAALLLLLPIAMTACGACDEDPASNGATETVAHPPAPPPPELVYELSVGGGSETFAAFRRLLGTQPVARMVPANPGAIVDFMAPALDLGARVPADAPVHAIGVRAADDVFNVIGVPVRTEASTTHPLGPALPTFPDGPGGGSYIGAAPGPDDEAAALLDDVVIFGEHPEALAKGAAYLAYTRVPGDAPPGVTLRVLDGFFADLRRMADAAFGESISSLESMAAAERRRHETAPEYGDPEAFIAALRGFGERWLPYLPDLGEARATANAELGLHIEMRAEVRDDSPLAQLLARTPKGNTDTVYALPADTAVALSMFKAPDDTEGFSVLETIAAIAGERLSARDGEALNALASAWDAARGPETVVALGGGAEDAWLTAVLPGARAQIPTSALTDAVGTSYLRTLLGLAFECAIRRGPRQGAPLCEGAPTLQLTDDLSPSVSLTREPDTFRAVTVAPPPGQPATPTFGHHPDVARALAVLGDDLLFTTVIVPSRVMPAAGLSNAEPLRALSRLTGRTARPAPIALGIAHDDGELVITLRASDRAIEDAITLGGGL